MLRKVRQMTKDELKQIPLLDKLIDVKLRELEELKAYRGRLPCVEGGEPVQSGGTSDPTASIAVKIVLLDKDINRDIDTLVEMKLEARELFKKLDGDVQLELLMNLRYLHGLSWLEIADEMGYTYRHIIRLHEDAMQKLF